MANRTWSYDETVLAFLKYCEMEFGKIHHNNPTIIEFASLLGRTPSSLTMKMGNLARFDPELRKRGISGLSNGSKMEEKVWKDFQSNSTDVIMYGEELLARLKEKDMGGSEQHDMTEQTIIPTGSSQKTVAIKRIGQDFFRKTILASYGYKCSITGINIPSLLIASHIKPWNVSDDQTEKTNPQNGLCLNAFHDRAFDQGLITIDLQYRVVVSKRLKELKADENTREWIEHYSGKQIQLPEKFVPDKRFIEYHNDVVFAG